MSYSQRTSLTFNLIVPENVTLSAQLTKLEDNGVINVIRTLKAK